MDNTNNFVRALMACLLLSLVLGASIPAAAPARADGAPVTGGNLFAWGWNAYGELGNGSTDSSNTPIQVSSLDGVTAISAGGHTLALDSDGNVWAWGWNSQGQLGNGTRTESHVPLQVSGLSGIFIAVAAGDIHSLALDSDGNVWAWGCGANGQLGNGSTASIEIPVKLSGISGMKAISAGLYHSLALKSDGTVWAWGRNTEGELGNGNTTDNSTPAQVSGLAGVTAISAGGYHSMALKSDGTVWAWGFNNAGQLGDNTNTQRNTPVQVNFEGEVLAVSAGGNSSLALMEDGTVWAWGANIGNSAGDSSNTPYHVRGALTGGFFTAVSAGSNHSLALKSDGTVWAWGRNNYGQLGNGTTDNSNVPVQVNGISGIVSIGAGEGDSFAVSTIILSSDITLSSLTISSGTLNPAFAAGTTTYTASVDNSVASITITPTVNESHATVTVNGQSVISGQPSQAINLNVGANTVTIVVTAQDGTTTETYTITVTRELSSVSLVVDEVITVSDAPVSLSSVSLLINEVITVSDVPVLTPSAPTVSLLVNEVITVSDVPVLTPSAPTVSLLVNEVITVSDSPILTPSAPTTYTLTMAVTGLGSTNPAVGPHTYAAGTVVPISATHALGWQFVNWTGDVADPNSASTDVTMDGDKTVMANFNLPVLNTPAGSNVVVQPVDTTTGSTPVTLTFSTVTQPGATTLNTGDPGPAPPAGFIPAGTYYHITTTAVFSGSVAVGITYDPAGITIEDELKLFHYENEEWVDVTTSHDTINHIITGGVTSLSPFGVFEPNAQELKSASIGKLEGAKTGDKDVDKDIDKVIKYINKSLDPALWIDASHLVFRPKTDWLHGLNDRFEKHGKTLDDDDIDNESKAGIQSLPGQKHGITVFHQELAAVMLMQNLIKNYKKEIPRLEKQIALKESKGRDASREKAKLNALKKALPVFKDVITDLVTADKILAQIAITDAKSTPVTDPKRNKIIAHEIKQAETEFARAMDAVNKDQPAIAVTRFSHAWQHAQLAMKFAALELPRPTPNMEPKDNRDRDKDKKK